MGTKKILGYIIAIIGIIAIATTFIEPLGKTIFPLLPKTITPDYILWGGVALIVIAIFLIVKSGRQRQKSYEVPIYHGRDVIGYRRT